MFAYNARIMAEQISLSEQYDRVKAEYPDAILFFRLGDFYEMFNNDAIEVSRLLNLTLTQRQSAPMCGIPWHASRNYITRLLKAGRKIAICEQIGSPQKGKGLIERKVVEVISPGTVNDEDFLEAVLDNYLVAVAVLNKGAEEHVSLAWLSSSTATSASRCGLRCSRRNSCVWDSMACNRLLKSCEIPPASRPTASIFCAWRSWASSAF